MAKNWAMEMGYGNVAYDNYRLAIRLGKAHLDADSTVIALLGLAGLLRSLPRTDTIHNGRN
jgi:hypothetical protein